MSSINPGTILNAAKGDPEAMRIVLNAMAAQLNALAQGTGVQLLEPTSGGRPQTPVIATPSAATLAVTGANGAYNISITPAQTTIAAALYFEVSYSAASNFGNATTLPLTPSTSFTFNAPGTTLYWRVRATYDKVHFGPYSPTSGGNPAVAASLQSSAATMPAVVLNQTNYCTVDSVPAGAGQNIRVYGQAGPQTQWIGVKGGVETIFPSATIINQSPGTKPFVGFDGEQFLVKSTLPQVFGDHVTPVGQVGVPPGGSVILPTIVAVTDGSGVTGFNVTSGGLNIGAPLNLTIGGPGTGAIAGTQTITGGALISVAPGAPGFGYVTAPPVTPSGGAATGSIGGGGATGSNPGRYIPPLVAEA